jgi:hypothetical protein
MLRSRRCSTAFSGTCVDGKRQARRFVARAALASVLLLTAGLSAAPVPAQPALPPPPGSDGKHGSGAGVLTEAERLSTYKEGVDRVVDVLAELGRELRSDPDYGPMILEDEQVLGVDALGESAVVIRMLVKTVPLKQWPVKRELLRRIENRFDELGIEIPFPHRTVYHHGAEGAPGPGADRDPDTRSGAA